MRLPVFFIFLLLCTKSFSATYTWDNGGGDNLWNNPLNWVGDAGTPTAAGDAAVFNGTSTANCTMNVVGLSIASITMSNAYTGTLTQSAGAGYTITLSGNYSQSNGRFVGGSANISVSNFALNDNIENVNFKFTSTSGTLTINGTAFTFAGLENATPPAFVHNSGKIVFTATVAFDGGAASQDFYDMEINGAVVTTSLGQISVTHQLDLTDGSLNCTTTDPVIIASGTVNFGQNFDGGTGQSLQLNCTGATTWDFRGDAFDRYLPGMEINSTNVTVYFNNNATYKTYITGDLDIEKGTVVGSSSDLYITRDLRISHEGLGSPTVTLSSGNTTIGRNYYYYNTPTFSHNNGTVVFNTTTSSNLYMSGGPTAIPFYNLTINKSGAATVNFGSVTMQLQGSFNDMSTTDIITESTSTMWVNGSVAQTLTSAVAGTGTGSGSTFYNLTIQNSHASGVTLAGTGHISIMGALTLTQGVVHSSLTNLLILENAATGSIGDNDSYVDGVVDFKMAVSGVTRTLLIPIASGTDWRPLELTVRHGAATSYTYRTTLTVSSPRDLGLTVPGTLQAITYIKYHTITRYTTSSGAEAKSTNLSTSAGSYPLLKIYYKTANGVNDEVTDYTGLAVAKSNTTETAWEDLGGTATANGNGSITSTYFTSFSKFVLANKAGSLNQLPITLLSFNAFKASNVVNLNWQTASEINNDYFTVERSSDGIAFEPIAIIKGAGNSNTILNYSTIDDQARTKNFEPQTSLYYRLKQTDFDGKFSYSDIRVVSLDDLQSFSYEVFPNPLPSGSTLNFELQTSNSKEVLIVLTDINGKELYSKEQVLETGNKQLSIESSNSLPPGIYFITASSKASAVRKKVLVR